MTPTNKGGRPRVGRQVTVTVTEDQAEAIQGLARMSGTTQSQAIRAVLEAGLGGKVQLDGWTYGPPSPDGRRYKWPPGYFDLSEEEE
jgi:Flp pilus assembly protein CpaB